MRYTVCDSYSYTSDEYEIADVVTCKKLHGLQKIHTHVAIICAICNGNVLPNADFTADDPVCFYCNICEYYVCARCMQISARMLCLSPYVIINMVLETITKCPCTANPIEHTTCYNSRILTDELYSRTIDDFFADIIQRAILRTRNMYKQMVIRATVDDYRSKFIASHGHACMIMEASYPGTLHWCKQRTCAALQDNNTDHNAVDTYADLLHNLNQYAKNIVIAYTNELLQNESPPNASHPNESPPNESHANLQQ